MRCVGRRSSKHFIPAHTQKTRTQVHTFQWETWTAAEKHKVLPPLSELPWCNAQDFGRQHPFLAHFWSEMLSIWPEHTLLFCFNFLHINFLKNSPPGDWLQELNGKKECPSLWKEIHLLQIAQLKFLIFPRIPDQRGKIPASAPLLRWDCRTRHWFGIFYLPRLPETGQKLTIQFSVIWQQIAICTNVRFLWQDIPCAAQRTFCAQLDIHGGTS